MKNNGEAVMSVEVRAPLMVFLGGYLLPHGAFAVQVSPLAPGVCDATVVRDHPGVPLPLRELMAKIAPDATELPVELQGGRVFQSITDARSGQVVFVELGLRNLLLAKMPPKVEVAAPELTA